MLNNIKRWFELNLGWFFINGNKQEAWVRYLRKKYKNENK
jgi:hypothetical protein